MSEERCIFTGMPVAEAMGIVVQEALISLTPTGDFNADKIRGENYAKAVGMNEANTKMTVIMATQGPAAAAKAMMEESGGDYIALRERYG